MPVLTPELLDAHLNNFALRCFRDIADGDYIAARMAFRVDLIPQALWSSEQAIEKYLKCLLLLQRISFKKPSHSPIELLEVLEKKFPLRLWPETREFIKYIDIYGPDRYFSFPYATEGLEIPNLDRAVWDLRRYCTRWTPGTSPRGTPLAEMDLKRVEDAVNRPPQAYRPLFPGMLDEILAKRGHACRSALIWNNLYFGASRRTKIFLNKGMYSANSPLALYPEIFDEVEEYIHLPKAVKLWIKKEFGRQTDSAS